MSRVLIIGAGAAGSVVVKKCAKNLKIFSHIHVASRSIRKCEDLKEILPQITISQLDADNSVEVVKTIKEVKPELVINMALPYQDLSIMDACLETGVNYLDTANYEPIDEAKFAYHWQWAYQERFKNKGIMALLGSGFDPGVTNVFCAYAKQELFDEIETVDILDCNGGDHGKAFATNFNPEINIREITQKGKYYENGEWIETKPMEISMDYDFPEVGLRKAYLMNHEEMESIVKHIPEIKRIRFWMTFGEEYITHLRILQNVGMTRIDPVEFNGQQIIPIQFLKALLPEPSQLGENYSGKTCIGCVITGIKDGKKLTKFIYNICDHQDSYKEVQAQAVSYTTGVPAVIGAKMILSGQWKGEGVFNMEQFNPVPFMDELNQQGLPWTVKELSCQM